MFANIRRHQKWLWILISGAVIISFVWYFNPNNRQSGSFQRERNVGSMNGRPITQGEYRDARAEAELQYFFNYGSWYGTDEFSRQNEGVLDRDTRTRLLLKEKAREYNIHVTPEEIAKWISTNFGRERAFTEADYNHVIKDILAPKGIRERDFENYVAGQIAIQHLVSVAGLPGRLVTPQEAETHYRQENEEASADAVFFDLTNYISKVKVDDAALGAFYTNRMSQYRIPDRIRIAYVEFPASNYFPQADQKIAGITNLAQRVDEMYQQRGAKFFTDTNDQVLPPEAAKQRIREELRTSTALVEAQRAATTFAEELLAMQGAKQISNLESLASQKGIVSKITEPFDQFSSPRGMEVPERFGQVAFALTTAEPFIEEPIRGSDAVYVAGLKDKIASSNPPLESIKDRVVEDFKRDEAQKMVTRDGQEFQAKLTNAVASGKGLTAAVSELGQKLIIMPPFTRATRAISGLERPDISRIVGMSFTLTPGEISQFMPSRDGGFILHLNKFIPADDAKVKAAVAENQKELQRSHQSQAFEDWFRKQMQSAKLSLITDKNESPTAQ